MCRTSHSLPFRAAVWVRSSGSHFDMLSPNVNHTRLVEGKNQPWRVENVIP